MSSSALVVFPFLGLEGLANTSLSAVDTAAVGVVVGISSHSSPAMLSCLRKNGQSLVKISKDSFASAADIGTGDDLMIALDTSDMGNARLLRFVGEAVDPVTGVEKSL